MKYKYIISAIFVLLFTMLLFVPVSADSEAFKKSEIPGIDFELYVNKDGAIKILPLNDINLADAYTYRKTNVFDTEDEKLEYSDVQNVLLKYLNQAVTRTSPDLIIITGNTVNGVDDYKGQLFNYVCKTIDSYNIPWAYAYGSSEGAGDYPFENKLADLGKYKNCIFKADEVGDYNYNIAVMQKDALKEVIYIIDSENTPQPDISEENEMHFAESYEKIQRSYGNIPCYVFTNHAPRYMFTACKEYGVSAAVNPNNPLTVNTSDGYGYFNVSPSGSVDGNKSFLELMKKCNVKGMFFGGESRIAAAVDYEGIRLGYIMKTGLFGIKEGSIVGTTLIEAHTSKCNVKYLPYEEAYGIFADVSHDAWYTDSVEYCYDRRLMLGVSDKYFGSGQTMTRGMFITILANIEGIDKSEYSGTSFTDVEAGNWYSAAVEWGYRNKISIGYGAKFGVNDPLTREQMARMLMQYVVFKGYGENAYSQELTAYLDYSSISDWALDAMHWVHENEILIGVEADNGYMMQPQAPATRSQIAAVVERFNRILYAEGINHPERTGRRENEILFIGNSRIYYGEAPEKTQMLSDFYMGGYTCVDSTQPGFSMTGNYLNMLCRKEFDPEFFSSADKVVLLAPDYEAALKWVMDLFPKDTEFYLLYVWEPYDTELGIKESFEGYNVKIIPAGDAYINMLAKGYDTEMFLAEDGFHPNGVLGYIQALTAYSVITETDISNAPEELYPEYAKDIKDSVKAAIDAIS